MLIDLLHSLVKRRFSRLGICSKILESEQCTIHYYESGGEQPRTLVLLHGLGTSSSTWVNILPRLVKTFHIIAIDLPGFGTSFLKDGQAYAGLNKMSDILVETLPAIASKPFTLVGHSLGGWLAMDYALRSPVFVQQIILINTAGIHYDGIEEQRRLFEITNLGSLYLLLNRLWLQYPWYFKPFAPAILSDLKKRKVAEFVRSIEQKDFLNDRLGSLKPPVHLIWGSDDAVISAETVQILNAALPGLSVRYIERCGHVPQLERPGELIRILDEILL